MSAGRPVMVADHLWVETKSRCHGAACPDCGTVIAITGMTFDLATPHGRMLATVLAGIAEFERDLISERVKSGLAAARARGKVLGRQKGQRPKSDRLAPKVLALVAEKRSYRWIARDLGISKNTVAAIVQRDQVRPSLPS